MSLIKKFDVFLKEELVATEPSIKKSIKSDSSLRFESPVDAAESVINRLSKIYSELSTEEKKEVDKYFE